MTDDVNTPKISEEQILYARVLEMGMYVGLVVLIGTFALYVSGVIAPAIPVEELPKYWEMNVHDYLEATNHDHLRRESPVTGWSWLLVLGYGDFLNFLGIALLSMVTIVCYLAIIPHCSRRTTGCTPPSPCWKRPS